MDLTPWHLRQPTIEHYKWFENLTELHQLTLSWLDDLNLDQKSFPHQLKRAMSPGVWQSFDILEDINTVQVPKTLDDVLDQSSPEELLLRLQHIVWAIQGWSLKKILAKTP